MAVKSTSKPRPKALTGSTGMVRGTYGCGGHLKACGGKISKRTSKRK